MQGEAVTRYQEDTVRERRSFGGSNDGREGEEHVDFEGKCLGSTDTKLE